MGDDMATDAIHAELRELIDGTGAHMTFEEAVADFPDDGINALPPNVPYTPWHLLEHLRLTQLDLLDYATNPSYEDRRWPEEYWPSKNARATRAQFDATIASFLADRAALRALVSDESVDLFAPLPWTPGHSIGREVRLAADHNAYHVGEFAVLRQVMGTWPPERAE
jgi:hypothetical protein